MQSCFVCLATVACANTALAPIKNGRFLRGHNVRETFETNTADNVLCCVHTRANETCFTMKSAHIRRRIARITSKTQNMFTVSMIETMGLFT